MDRAGEGARGGLTARRVDRATGCRRQSATGRVAIRDLNAARPEGSRFGAQRGAMGTTLSRASNRAA